jgi:hypothetical protein
MRLMQTAQYPGLALSFGDEPVIDPDPATDQQMWWIPKRPDAQVVRDQADWRGGDRRLRVLSYRAYRVILDVPLPLVVFVSGLLAAHRRELGTRDGTRALTCWKQAVFTLAKLARACASR